MNKISAFAKRVGFVLASWVIGAAAQADLPINTRLGGAFNLPSTVNAEGTALSDYEGRLVLLNFGFTHCPDVCPTVLMRLAKVRKALGADANDVQVLFVTFDPERDTLEHMTAYLQYFDSSFVGFRGTEQETDAILKQYGAIAMPVAARNSSSGVAGTVFSHTDFVYLLDQQGRVRALYATDDSTDEIVSDIRSLLDRPWWVRWFSD